MKIMLGIAALAVYMVASAGPKENLAKAVLLEKQGKFRKAGMIYGALYRAEKSREKQAEYLGYLADCHLRVGESAKAVEIYKKILSEYPKQSASQLAAVSKIKEGRDYWNCSFFPTGDRESGTEKALRARLERIVIGKVKLSRAPLDRALDELFRLAAKADKNKSPFNLVLLHDRTNESSRRLQNVLVARVECFNITELTRGKALIVEDSREDKPWGEDDDDDDDDDDDVLPKITLELKGARLGQILYHLTDQAGYRLEIRGKYLIVIPDEYTTDRLYVDVIRLPEGFRLDDDDDVLGKIQFSLPTSTAGHEAFLTSGLDSNVVISYNTKANHDKLRRLASALEQSLCSYVDLSLDLISVKADGLPAFVKMSHLAKIPANDKKILDAVNVSTVSGQEATANLTQKQYHRIRVVPTLGADQKTIHMRLDWDIEDQGEIESSISSRFAFQVDHGRVLKLGIVDGRYLLGVIAARVSAPEVSELELVKGLLAGKKERDRKKEEANKEIEALRAKGEMVIEIDQ